MSDSKLENKVLWILVIVLFSCLSILIFGMFNGTILSDFDKGLYDSISNFGGALVGASIAGYLSIKVFEKGLEHESNKENAELIVSKVLYLNDYLDLTKRLYFQLKDIDLNWKETIHVTSHHNQQKTDDEEFEECNRTTVFFQSKHDVMVYYLSDTERKLVKLNYEHIKDIEFRLALKNHHALLNTIFDHIEMINEFTVIDKYGLEYWSVRDLLSYIQQYISGYDQLEKYYYQYK